MPASVGRVAGRHRVGGEDQVRAVRPPRRTPRPGPAPRRGARAPAAPARTGPPPAASCRPATSGRPAGSARPSGGSPASRASSCTVLPSPMSSASTPPSPSDCRKASQASPRCWYGRSVPAEARRRVHRGEPPLGLRRRAGRPARRRRSTSSTGSAVRRRRRRPARAGAGRRRSSRRAERSSRSPAASRFGSSSTHCPRSRTSGVFSSASARQLLGGERLVAEGHLPAVVDQRVQADAGSAAATVPGAVRLRGRQPGAEPGRRAAPPAGQQHPETGGVQHRRALAQEPVRPLDVQLQRLRARPCAGRRPAPARAGWPGPARRAASPAGWRPTGQAAERLRRSPDLRGVDVQAGLVGGLQPELHPPAPGRRPTDSARRPRHAVGGHRHVGGHRPLSAGTSRSVDRYRGRRAPRWPGSVR